MQAKPLLLIDVDGVISLWGFADDTRPEGRYATVDGIVHFLSLEAASQLRALSGDFELVWCTGWQDRANDHLPHLLGMPGPLPSLTFTDPPATSAHWKLGAVRAFTGAQRPVAWIDDAFDASCEAWARERPGPTLLVPTEPSSGLGPAHARRLRAWAAALREGTTTNAPRP